MGIFGSIAGGALGIGGAIFGGISASKAMKKVKKNLEEQQKENESWYDRHYNEDATQRADAQEMLKKLDESVRNRNREAAATAAVAGGTEESLAATKAANAQAMADATAQIALNGERRKDSVDREYRATKADLNEKLNNMEIGKANAMGQAIQGAADAGANLMGMF